MPNKYCKYEELDDAIKAAEARLYYLRNRKKTGAKGVVAGKVRDKEREADYAFYNYWVQHRDFLAQYNKLRSEMTESAKHFVAYHNRIIRVVDTFGTKQQQESLKALMGKYNEEINM